MLIHKFMNKLICCFYFWSVESVLFWSFCIQIWCL